MPTKSLSKKQLKQAVKAIQKKGWPKTDERWLIAASYHLEPSMNPKLIEDDGIYADGVSRPTWIRFLNGESIREESFNAFCSILNLDADELIPEYVQRPPVEELCWQELQREPGLVRVSSIRGTGKTKLIDWTIAQARKCDYKIVIVDFDSGFDNALSSFETFIIVLQEAIADNLGLSLKETYESISKFIEKQVLAVDEKPVLLILEKFDRVFENEEIANQFSGLLRAFYNTKPLIQISGHLWKKLRLVITHSTELYPTFNINSSPLVGVGTSIHLKDFSCEQVRELCSKISQKTWSNQDINQLIKLVGGHPRLLRLAINYVDHTSANLDDVLNNLHRQDGPYWGHLRELEWYLERNPELQELFSRILTHERINLKSIANSKHRYWLVCSGLVKESHSWLEIRYELYRNYFSNYID